MKPQIQFFKSLKKMNQKAAQIIKSCAQTCIEQKRLFNLVLTGGKSPQSLYLLLGSEPFFSKFPWEQTQVFFTDERFVPEGDPNHNQSTMTNALLKKLPNHNIHPIHTNYQNPELAAQFYEKQLREFFKISGSGFPIFDLVLLGLGPDGHIASLFPSEPTLKENNRWVVAVTKSPISPQLPRVTLTLPVINRAQTVLFLATGKGKASVLRQIIPVPSDAANGLPAALVKPKQNLIWLVDKNSYL